MSDNSDATTSGCDLGSLTVSTKELSIDAAASQERETILGDIKWLCDRATTLNNSHSIINDHTPKYCSCDFRSSKSGCNKVYSAVIDKLNQFNEELPQTHQFPAMTEMLAEHLSSMDKIPNEPWTEWMDDQMKMSHICDAVSRAKDEGIYCKAEESKAYEEHSAEQARIREALTSLEGATEEAKTSATERLKVYKRNVEQSWDETVRQIWLPVNKILSEGQTYVESLQEPIPINLTKTGKLGSDMTVMSGVNDLLDAAHERAKTWDQARVELELDKLEQTKPDIAEEGLTPEAVVQRRAAVLNYRLDRTEFQGRLDQLEAGSKP